MPSKRISRRILRDKGFQKHKYCETKMKSSQKDVSVEGEPTKRFLQAWVWKREAKPDKERFVRPYLHKVSVSQSQIDLVIGQSAFKEVGFASTVWDSSIVLAKFFEKWPELVSGKSCLELGSGCGLVSVVLAVLGAAKVCATDLEVNLPLLKENCVRNKVDDKVNVEELEWGIDVMPKKAFDLVVATDVLYDEEAVKLLVPTLYQLCSEKTDVYVAYGRNRWAETEFNKLMDQYFLKDRVHESKLDDVYQCLDVDVFRFKIRMQ